MNAPLDELERLLLAQVDEARGAAAGTSGRDAAVVAALRGALSVGESAPEETIAFGARMAQLLPGESPSDARLAVRFEQAMKAALDAVGGGTIAAAPRIVVLRDDVHGDTRRAGSLDGLGGTLSRDPRPSLILAGDQARAALEEGGDATIGTAAKVVALPPLPAPIVRAAAAAVPPRPLALGPGEWIGGKYRIVREIGRGGFGAVFEARDETLGSRVAIKVMNARAACTAAEMQEFKDEARRVTRLSHPNIVDWKSFDELPDGSSYFVMELLEGEDLETILQREKKIAPGRAMDLLLQALDALRAAHQLSATESILHLDLKPRNLFLIKGQGGRERVKVIDFGIGQYVGGQELPSAAAGAGAAADGGGGTSTLRAVLPEGARSGGAAGGDSATGSGGSSGVHRSSSCTPEYASPEQCAHLLPGGEIQPLDGRSDLFSLGVIAYQMVTGELPWPAPKKRMDWLRVHLEEEPRRLVGQRTQAPRAFARFVDRCLMRDRDARFASSAEAFAELERIVHPPLVRHLAWAAPLLVAAVTLTWFMWRRAERVALAKARFPLLEAASREPVRDRVLYLGPERRSATLVADQLRLEPGTRLVLEDSRREPLGSFEAAVDGHGQIVVSGRGEPAARVEERASLRVAGGDEEGRVSDNVALVWLGGESWTLGAIGIAELGGRSLDPSGQSLEIEVSGAAPTDLERLQVRAGARTADARLEKSDGATTRWRAPLDALQLEGDAVLVVEAVDFGGRKVERRWPESGAVAIVTRPLEQELTAPLQLDAIRMKERWLVAPRTAPRLTATLSRPATLTLGLFDRDGKRVHEWPTQRGTEFDVDLDAIKSAAAGASWSGELRARLDESESVARVAASAPAGVVEKAFRVDCSNEQPDFFAELVDGRGSTLLAGGGVAWSAASEASVRVRQTSTMPLRVVVEARAPDGTVVPLLEQPLEVGGTQEVEAKLPLPGEGTWELRLRAWRIDAAARGGPSEGDAEIDRTARLVVDRSAPRLALAGLERALVVRGADEGVPTATVALDEAVGAADGPVAADATPARVEWRLERLGHAAPDAATGEVVERGVAAAALLPGQRVPLEVPRPWRSASGDVDGTWRLVVEAKDAAGNPATTASAAWRVALAGPRVELLEPSSVARFVATERPDGGGFGWAILVRATDENGVGAVDAVARLAGVAGGREIAFVTECRSDGHESVWEGWLAEPFPATWSQRKVEIELRATDRDGSAAAPRLEQRELPRLTRTTPPRIVGGHGLGDVAALVHVGGNTLARYVFGGQVEAEENRLFLAAGLPLYAADGEPPRSWRREVRSEAIADLYVDETEVTNEQYVRFLAADDGYRAPRWWGRELDEAHAARADALAARLAGEAPDLPVTAVRWDEADAFARWSGKRLPTLLEWEWLVRGADYRPWSGARPGVAPDVARIHVARRRGGPASVRAPETIDVTPEGVRDLCDNVAEWLARGEDDGLVDPAERWVAGGSFASSAFHFAKVEVAWDDEPRPSIGFRCVVAAGDALDSLEGDAAERYRSAPPPLPPPPEPEPAATEAVETTEATGTTEADAGTEAPGEMR